MFLNVTVESVFPVMLLLVFPPVKQYFQSLRTQGKITEENKNMPLIDEKNVPMFLPSPACWVYIKSIYSVFQVSSANER